MEWYHILLIIMLSLIVLLLIVLTISYITYKMAFYHNNKKEDPYDLQVDVNEKEKEFMFSLIDEFMKIEYEQINIVSFDGTMLSARYYHIDDNAPIQIQCHGYKGMAFRDMCGGNKLAREAKFNTLVIDQRAHGQSKGHTITFGINESKDCLSWINYINDRFKNKNDIVLVGVSMGASTVLLTSQYELPSNVKGIIADCPFSSPKDIIKKVIKDMKLPVKLIYPFLYLGAKIFGRFDMNDGNIAKVIKNCKIPVLLIHGTNDELVPCEMSRLIYENNKEYVDIFTVEKAKHGLSFIVDINKYIEVVTNFINKLNLNK